MSDRFYTRRPAGQRTMFSSGRTEPSMRDEMENTLDGKWPEISKKQPAILRKMRRTAAGSKIACACVSPLTHEPDKDTFCPICHGEGWLWDEVWVDVYSVELGSDVGKAIREEVIAPGLENIPLMVFYMRSTVPLTLDDKIVEMERNTDGTVSRPYKRARLYRINALVDLRSDNGRLEYWKVDCYAEERRFLNG